jgi:hypothetical protein
LFVAHDDSVHVVCVCAATSRRTGRRCSSAPTCCRTSTTVTALVRDSLSLSRSLAPVLSLSTHLSSHVGSSTRSRTPMSLTCTWLTTPPPSALPFPLPLVLCQPFFAAPRIPTQPSTRVWVSSAPCTTTTPSWTVPTAWTLMATMCSTCSAPPSCSPLSSPLETTPRFVRAGQKHAGTARMGCGCMLEVACMLCAV